MTGCSKAGSVMGMAVTVIREVAAGVVVDLDAGVTADADGW